MKRFIGDYLKKKETDPHYREEPCPVSIFNKNKPDLIETDLSSPSHDFSNDLTNLSTAGSTFDIKNYVGKKGLTDSEKIDSLSKIWAPGK